MTKQNPDKLCPRCVQDDYDLKRNAAFTSVFLIKCDHDENKINKTGIEYLISELENLNNDYGNLSRKGMLIICHEIKRIKEQINDIRL